MEKHAVDSATESYWSDYFGEYGKQWTRSIPRRIGTLLAERTLARTAERGDDSGPAARVVAVRPVGAPVVDGGRVLVEGTALFVVGDRRVARLWSASFNHEGRLLDIDAVPMPVA